MFPAKKYSSYNDVRLFLWLIPVVNFINYYLTYTRISFSWRFFITFSIDTVEGYIAWLLVKAVIIWLDKKMPYEPSPGKRIIVQLVLTILAGLSAVILLTELVNFIAGSTPVPSSFYSKDIFIISIWFFVINGIYTGLHYYEQWKTAETAWKKENEVKINGFKVSTSKKELMLPFEDIGGFYIDGEYSVVVTTDRKKFLVDTSLDKVEKGLPFGFFFRLNRQYIVHRQFVAGFEKAANGKINVLLKDHDHLPASIPVSRNRAPEFKTWFSPS